MGQGWESRDDVIRVMFDLFCAQETGLRSVPGRCRKTGLRLDPQTEQTFD